MSLEGKQEKIVTDMVYCAGVQGLLKITSCNDKCEHFAGVREEPVKKKDANGEVEIIGCNKWVLCRYPKPERIKLSKARLVLT